MLGKALAEISHFRGVFRAAATFQFSFLELKIGGFGIFSSGEKEQNVHLDPHSERIHQNVSCKISATTMAILDFNGSFEPPDP